MPPSPSAFHSLTLPFVPFVLNPILSIYLSPFRGTTSVTASCCLLERVCTSLLVLFFSFFFISTTHRRRVFVNKNRRARQAVWLSRENGNPILVLRPLKGARAHTRDYYRYETRVNSTVPRSARQFARWKIAPRRRNGAPLKNSIARARPVHRDFCTQTEVPPPKVIYKRHVYKCKVESHVFHPRWFTHAGPDSG